jgi:hypothetical protein
MKKSGERQALAPVDIAQRYATAEATSYLRISHASIYKEINARRIRVLKHGKRTFVPGSEIARLSRLEGRITTQIATSTSAPVKPEIKESTAYRPLDSRIHQALMKETARQQALWDCHPEVRRQASVLDHAGREPHSEPTTARDHGCGSIDLSGSRSAPPACPSNSTKTPMVGCDSRLRVRDATGVELPRALYWRGMRGGAQLAA